MKSIPGDTSPVSSLSHPAPAASATTGTPSIIVNADDWGRECLVTDRTLDCVHHRALSSVSAMVFMEDSERAAELARVHRIDAGLHLNLSTPFTARNCPAELLRRQRTLIRFLRSSYLSPALYNPWLAATFEYVVAAQREEYERLYGKAAARIDGHHHMHLCANVVRQKLLPAGTIVRRNFSFRVGEKSALNRYYRLRQDREVGRRHRMTDYFFALPPMDVPGRLEGIFALATRSAVEMETHPVNPEEYAFLTGGELQRRAGRVAIATSYNLS